MATGDVTDFGRRMRAMLPRGWWGDSSPIRDAVLAALGTDWAATYGQAVYAKQQTRIATATDTNLDAISGDLLGTGLPRLIGETDTAYRARIKANVLAPKATRAAMIRALTLLTGKAPLVFEPARASDTGGYATLSGTTLPWLVQEDFTAETALSSFWTFSRPSPATYWDSTGTQRVSNNGQPRFDHTPLTGATALGLLMEPAGTNYVRNSTMAGAVPGTPGTPPNLWSISLTGGLSYQVVAVPTVSGMTVLRVRVYGTTTNTSPTNITFETTGVSGLAVSTTVTQTQWLALNAGSFANITSGKATLWGPIYDNTAADVVDVQTGVVPTGTIAQFTKQATTPASGNTPFYQHNAGILLYPTGSGVAIDITLDIAAPQLEVSANATSFIPTTNAAGTRAAETCTASIAIGSAISGFAEFQSNVTGGVIAGVTDAGGFTDSAYAWLSGGSAYWQAGGANLGGAYTLGTGGRIAFAADRTGCTARVAGGALSQTRIGTLSPAFTTLAVGGAPWNTASQLSGWVRKVAFYSRRRPATDVTAMSATSWLPSADLSFAGTGCYYGAAGGYGNLSLPFQAFVTAYRAVSGGIPNVAGYAAGAVVSNSPPAGGYGSLLGSGPLEADTSGTSLLTEAGGVLGADGTGSCAVGGYGNGGTLAATSPYSFYASYSQITGNLTDALIYQTIANTAPAATIMWTRITG